MITSELSAGGAKWAARQALPAVGWLWPSDDDDDDGGRKSDSFFLRSFHHHLNGSCECILPQLNLAEFPFGCQQLIPRQPFFNFFPKSAPPIFLIRAGNPGWIVKKN